MGKWSWLFEGPQQEHLESQRFWRLALLWVFAFITAIRALVLVQFMVDLDYSEINPVKLTQFLFIQTLVLCFLVYLMIRLWSRPQRFLLATLLILSAWSLFQQQDLVSLLSALVVVGLTLKLAGGLYPKTLFQWTPSSPQEQLTLPLENSSDSQV